MMSSIGTPTSSFGSGCRATPMGELLVMIVVENLWSGGGLRQRRSAGLDQFPDALRGQRQLARLDPECAEGICHRIRHDAAGRDDAALAGAFGAERIDRGREHV